MRTGGSHSCGSEESYVGHNAVQSGESRQGRVRQAGDQCEASSKQALA
jgi:hypothetical protein